MKMKKILALVLAAIMALALVACGGGNNAGNPGATPGNNTQKDDNANAGRAPRMPAAAPPARPSP